MEPCALQNTEENMDLWCTTIGNTYGVWYQMQVNTNPCRYVWRTLWDPSESQKVNEQTAEPVQNNSKMFKAQNHPSWSVKVFHAQIVQMKARWIDPCWCRKNGSSWRNKIFSRHLCTIKLLFLSFRKIAIYRAKIQNKTQLHLQQII